MRLGKKDRLHSPFSFHLLASSIARKPSHSRAEAGEEMAINLHAGTLPHKFQLFSAAAFQPISPAIIQPCSRAGGAQQKEGQDPQPPEPLAGSSAQAELSSAQQTPWHSPISSHCKGMF